MRIPWHSRPVSVENQARQPPTIADRLLAWYDRHARALPWRSPPGTAPPDPYHVLLSELMLQQTQVATVQRYFAAFIERWPTITALAAADDVSVMSAWAGLGYYSRARNLLAAARTIVAAGTFPADEAALRRLPGVGRYTAAAMASIAFGQRAVVVDGNVERVIARLFAVDTPLPAASPILRRLTETIMPTGRHGDFAQAMMDLGATVCTPRNPNCLACPLAASCQAAATGDSAQYPRRLPKLAKPQRTAIAHWIERAGQVLLVRRPPTGLFGGMRALPCDLGIGTDALRRATVDDRLIGQVAHVFTHFRLTLNVVAVQCKADCNPPLAGEWWPIADLAAAGLPTLFAKAAQVAIGDRPLVDR